MRLTSAAEVKAAQGRDEYVSEWLEIDQSRVNRFADATDDHQWIHVDVERANKEWPLVDPLAHGFLTLALVPMWLEQCMLLLQIGRELRHEQGAVHVKRGLLLKSELTRTAMTRRVGLDHAGTDTSRGFATLYGNRLLISASAARYSSSVNTRSR